MPRSLEQLPFFAVDGMYLVYQLLVWDACYLPSRFDRRKTGQGGTGWAMIPLKRGQAIAVRGDIANRTGLTPDKVRYRIEKLVELGYVSTETVSGYMVATITHYDAFHTPPDYPRKSPQTNSTENTNDFVDASDQSNSSDPGLKDEKSPDYPQTNPRLTPTTNKEKKEKKEKKNTGFNPLSIELTEPMRTDACKAAWSEWCQHRKQISKPYTELACKKQLSAMDGWNEYRVIDAINHSILNGWPGIYERNTAKPANNAQPSAQIRNITEPIPTPPAATPRLRDSLLPKISKG